MASEPRLTYQSLKVLRAFLDARLYQASGADIIKTTKLASGTIYPILFRFEDAGWLVAHWEEVDPVEAGRPRRRYYRLTGAGQRVAQQRLAEFAPTTGGPEWAR